MTLAKKKAKLRKILREMKNVIVAFSGGIDSTLLLAVAKEELGKACAAITIASATIPQEELEDAQTIACELEVQHYLLEGTRLNTSWFSSNPNNRCYICKKDAFQALLDFIKENKLEGELIEGSNVDDLDDYRPGFQAITELGIRSPLIEAKFTKEDIRQFAKELGLRVWNKPAMACLATRIPVGEPVTKEKLTAIAESERFLRTLGLLHIRVRNHSDIARIETSLENFQLVLDNTEVITKKLKELGFKYVTLDLAGYQKGSTNKETS